MTALVPTMSEPNESLYRKLGGLFVLVLFLCSGGSIGCFIYSLVKWDSYYAATGLTLFLLILYLILEARQGEVTACDLCQKLKQGK